jgi:hypothetical protein
MSKETDQAVATVRALLVGQRGGKSEPYFPGTLANHSRSYRGCQRALLH